MTVEPSFLWYNFCGVLFGMSLVIPGLTSSSVMMALGLYGPMMAGLARLDVPVLASIVPGLVLSVLLLARLVTWFFREHYAIASHGIFGIVLASTLVIIPTEYAGMWEVLLSAVCCVGGFLLAFFMDRLDRRIQDQRGTVSPPPSSICIKQAPRSSAALFLYGGRAVSPSVWHSLRDGPRASPARGRGRGGRPPDSPSRPWGEPGRLTMSAPPRMPAWARDSMARLVTCREA